MKVFGKRVLVQRGELTEKYGSLYLPEKSRQRPQEGVVIAVGEKVTSVHPGERVLFGRYAGTEVDTGQEDQVMLWEADLMGVLE